MYYAFNLLTEIIDKILCAYCLHRHNSRTLSCQGSGILCSHYTTIDELRSYIMTEIRLKTHLVLVFVTETTVGLEGKGGRCQGSSWPPEAVLRGERQATVYVGNNVSTDLLKWRPMLDKNAGIYVTLQCTTSTSEDWIFWVSLVMRTCNVWRNELFHHFVRHRTSFQALLYINCFLFVFNINLSKREVPPEA